MEDGLDNVSDFYSGDESEINGDSINKYNGQDDSSDNYGLFSELSVDNNNQREIFNGSNEIFNAELSQYKDMLKIPME